MLLLPSLFDHQARCQRVVGTDGQSKANGTMSQHCFILILSKRCICNPPECASCSRSSSPTTVRSMEIFKPTCRAYYASCSTNALKIRAYRLL
jgi:hypothetical protein